MDGTLLNSAGVVSATNAAMIKHSGVPLTLVSARAPMEMAAAIHMLNLHAPQIGFNGGLIYQPGAHGWNVISQRTIEFLAATTLLRAVATDFPNVSLSFYDLNRWYADRVTPGLRYEAKLTGQTPTLADWRTVLTSPTEPVFKVMMITFDRDEMARLQQFVRSLQLPHVAIAQSGTAYLEVTHIEAQKSRGINYIMTREHLQPADTAAFGDGHNDLPMLKMVGTPVVMANALPEIKAVGQVITKSNDEDGVGYGLQQLL
ncbi:Cof-type HAD-IIB family hydrolase [Lacticaseibacillus thailandensis]|uniref:Cof-like hydrolase family protein n=2 Tax=Lacticaseibacillus thailandensis TaxID=381741 RepID=A0A0R2CEI7_9LACO|nr:Cof-type HAD-IIB family hydrolase [Lacticaseibacillus thailandensis]KRM86779.1 Cof-like hydrolase family protein [Lacticaseibacillus thailandensis DSM 22698 = JCM 13996]